MTRNPKMTGLSLLLGSVLLAGCGSDGSASGDDLDPAGSGSPGAAASAGVPVPIEAPPASATVAPATEAPAAGACISDEVDDEGDRVPLLDAVVTCTDAHIYEITAVVDLPESVITGESDEEKLANRAELAAPTGQTEASAIKADYTAFADEACGDAVLDAVGWGSMSLLGVSADDAQLQPLAWSATPVWISVMPEEQWLAGNTQVVCSTRFTGARAEPDGTGIALPAVAPVASPDAGMLISHYATKDFPADLRQCAQVATDGTRTYQGCDGAHYEEYLFTYDAKAVLGADFVNGVAPDAVSDQQYDRFDEVCNDVLDEMLPGYDSARFKGNGLLGTQGWGTVDAAYYQGQCAVTAKDSANFDLPAGSLMGTDGAGVEPVPYAG